MSETVKIIVTYCLTASFLCLSALSASAQNVEDIKPDVSDQPTVTAIETDKTIDQALPGETTKKTVETNWRDSVGVFSIGYLVDGNKEHQRRKMEPFRLALQRKTGLKVTYRPVETLSQLIKLQIDRRIQYALHSASSYVTTKALCKCVEALVVPTDRAGAAGVHAVLIAPFSGKVRGLSDLKGHRLALPAPPATITRLLPLNRFKAAGYDKPDDMGEIVEVSNPVEGWRKVMAGEADAAIGWSSLQGDLTRGYSSGTLRHLIEVTEIARSTDMRVVWRSEMVPHPPHVLRSDVPTVLKKMLREFLLDIHLKNRAAYDAVSPVLSGGFVEVSEEDFRTIRRLVEQSE